MKRTRALTFLLLASLLATALAQTPALIRSVESRNRVAFEALLAVTAQLDERDGLDRTALMVAVAGDQLGMVAALLERGADPNLQSADGRTALHYAVASSTRELMFELLLGAGADPLIADGAGETPRGLAIAVANRAAIPLLQEAERQRIADHRWLRVLGVPRPVGPVLGVSVLRRTIDADGRIGPRDDVHVWVFDGAGRPLRDEQVLVFDEITIRNLRSWSFDAAGRLLLVEQRLNDLNVTQIFDETPDRLLVEQRGGPSGYAASYLLDGGSVRGTLAFSNAGGREVSSQLFTFASEGWAMAAVTSVGDEAVTIQRWDVYNQLREEVAYDATVRFDVVARDRFGQPTRAVAYRLGREQAVEQIDYLYAYGALEGLEGPLVRVVTYAVRVRAEPGLTTESLNNQFGGAAGVLLATEPRWVDGYWWWHIRFLDGTVGWSAHGDAEELWLADATGAPLPLPTERLAVEEDAPEGADTASPPSAPSDKLARGRASLAEPGSLLGSADEPIDSPYVALWYELAGGAVEVFIVDVDASTNCRWSLPPTRWLDQKRASDMARGETRGAVTLMAWTSAYGFRDGVLGRYEFAVTTDDRCWSLFTPQ